LYGSRKAVGGLSSLAPAERERGEVSLHKCRNSAFVNNLSYPLTDTAFLPLWQVDPAHISAARPEVRRHGIPQTFLSL